MPRRTETWEGCRWTRIDPPVNVVPSEPTDHQLLFRKKRTVVPLRWLRKYQHTPSVGIKVNYRRNIFWKESEGVCHSVWLAKHVNCWLPSINKQYTSKECEGFFPYKQKNQNVYVCEYVCLYCKRLGTQDWLWGIVLMSLFSW